MTPTERLLVRLRAQGVELPEGTTLHRTYAGSHQRAAGAWSWFLLGPGGHDLGLGSHWPVGVLLKAPQMIVSEDADGMQSRSVDPEPLPGVVTPAPSSC